MPVEIKGGHLTYVGKLNSKANIEEFKTAFEQHPEIRELKLSDCGISDEVMDVILPIISKSPLKRIDVSNNVFTGISALKLVTAFSKKDREIVVDLKKNHILPKIKEEIDRVIQNNSGLECSLPVGRFVKGKRNGKMPFDFEELGRGLSIGEIYDLDLSSCGLKDADISKLEKLLEKQYQHLRRLNLNGNEISMYGAAALKTSIILRKCPNLIEVSLASNYPGVERSFQDSDLLKRRAKPLTAEAEAAKAEMAAAAKAGMAARERLEAEKAKEQKVEVIDAPVVSEKPAAEIKQTDAIVRKVGPQIEAKTSEKPVAAGKPEASGSTTAKLHRRGIKTGREEKCFDGDAVILSCPPEYNRIFLDTEADAVVLPPSSVITKMQEVADSRAEKTGARKKDEKTAQSSAPVADSSWSDTFRSYFRF